ncbi:hypothetical protein evm_007213 [Chilo suppressalis]|nr:hypothetical protein evm_007213 [Chilo suppressalis]
MRIPKALNPRIQNRLLKRFGVYDLVFPGDTTPSRKVPEHIVPPDYISGKLLILPRKPEIKDNQQIASMQKSCQLANTILNKVQSFIMPGITTDQIDELVHNMTVEADAYPSPLHYKGFPKSVCTSVNNVVVHGIPDLRPLLDGDIVNVDITVFIKGFHGDCSKTFTVGKVDDRGLQLIQVTEECLEIATRSCGPDVPFNEIGKKIYHHAKRNGLTVLPAFVGHGIGEYFHGPPEIYHTKNRYPGVMKPGMTFTIEPALSHGSAQTVLLEDGWTVITEDGARAAQRENTILITKDGAEILTK